MTLAVITIVHGRHEHLAMQHAALTRSIRLPDSHIVVAMDDPEVEQPPRAPFQRRTVHVPRIGPHLPLAHARNIGAQRAIADGATVLVFLDVDCIPSEGLLTAYEEAATGHVPASAAGRRIRPGHGRLVGAAAYCPSAAATGNGHSQSGRL
jgi:N-acetylglucosaminyl-diphospho-decaprenol L-rhamnosyltransferase